MISLEFNGHIIQFHFSLKLLELDFYPSLTGAGVGYRDGDV